MYNEKPPPGENNQPPMSATPPVTPTPVAHVAHVPAPVEIVNPLLARVELPGSTFQMPSRGLFYVNNELREDVNMGEVHVHPMSTYDEILMKTPDKLFSGEAVNEVFVRCIPQILKPTELLARDVDFLLVCLRQVTFGDELEIKYTHDCKEANNNSYMVNISTFLTNTKRIEPTSVGSIYSTNMENNQIVKLHPAKFKDVLKMYQDVNTGDHSTEDELSMTVFIIKSVIHSVDEITDDKMIEQWIQKIPAGWVRHLSSVIEQTSDFGPDFTFETKCKDCGAEIQIESPINPISFFM